MDSRNKNGEIMNHNINICRFHVNMQIFLKLFLPGLNLQLAGEKEAKCC